VGVSDPAMAAKMLGVLQSNGAIRAMVVYGQDGLDELTTTCPSVVHELAVDADGSASVRTFTVDPAALGLRPAVVADLRGGDPACNADAARRILGGEPGPQRDVVLLNAAAGLVVAGHAADLTEGLIVARSVIDDGRAGQVVERLAAVSQEVSGADA